MNRTILPFDKENISEEEIQEHINWYVAKAEEGKKLINVDNKQAMEVLREINRNLKEEYTYFGKTSLMNILYTGDELKNRYFHAIRDSYVKQSRKTSYAGLYSNLYDVSSYMSDTEFM